MNARSTQLLPLLRRPPWPVNYWALRALLLMGCCSFIARGATSNTSDTLPALLPPRGELKPGFWELYGGWVICGSVFVLAFILLLTWALARRRPPLIPPPEYEARRALEPLAQQPESGALLSRVSQITRHYFSAAFRLPPGELTTSEFCRALPATVDPGFSTEVTDFLRECDRRKFAPAAPSTPLGAVATASRLIEKAEALRQTPPVPAPTGAASQSLSAQPPRAS